MQNYSTCLIIRKTDSAVYPGLCDHIDYISDNRQTVMVIKDDHLECLGGTTFKDADSILSLNDVKEVIGSRLGPNYESIPGIEAVVDAYYSRFAGMEIAAHSSERYILLWDGCNLPCRPISIFDDNDKPYLDVREELLEDDIYRFIRRIVEGLDKAIEPSFFTGHILVDTVILKNMLAEIEQNSNLSGHRWWEKIINVIDTEYITSVPVNMYEYYGTYVLMHSPAEYRIRAWKMFRPGADLFVPQDMTDQDLEWLGNEYDSIYFEAGHDVREDNKGLFDNPAYRARLTAMQMLNAVQGEYQEKAYADEELKTDRLINGFKIRKATDIPEYKIYERIGDRKNGSNKEQAWLSWQHAKYLCEDQSEKERINNKMQELGVTVPKVSIVIASYNSSVMMRECLDSIRKNCNPDTYSIIIVDNASTDGVREYLQEQKDIILICNNENMGFPKACNQGIEAAPGGEDIFFLNNDVQMTRNALYWVRMGLYESGDTGASGCISNYAGIGQMRELLLANEENYCVYGGRLNTPVSDPYDEAKILCGFAMLVKRECIDNLGGMDEAFSPGYYEDTDLSLRLRANGYRLRICKNSFIYHAGGKSFKKRPDLDAINDRNLLYLAQKWGTDFMDQ